jgi:hypothetical protein
MPEPVSPSPPGLHAIGGYRTAAPAQRNGWYCFANRRCGLRRPAPRPSSLINPRQHLLTDLAYHCPAAGRGDPPCV